LAERLKQYVVLPRSGGRLRFNVGAPLAPRPRFTSCVVDRTHAEQTRVFEFSGELAYLRGLLAQLPTCRGQLRGQGIAGRPRCEQFASEAGCLGLRIGSGEFGLR
jgi:hypothetical protein